MSTEEKSLAAAAEARRRFLAACGKFALATPPAVALMLSVAEGRYAVASSGGGGGGDPGGKPPIGNDPPGDPPANTASDGSGGNSGDSLNGGQSWQQRRDFIGPTDGER